MSPHSNPCRFASILTVPVLVVLCACQADWPDGAQPVSRNPVLYPDYGETVIAPNVAPLNFQIKESGVRFRARIEGENGGAVEVSSTDGKIRWPVGEWKQLMTDNRGASVSVTITVQDPDGACRKFDSVRIGVAEDDLDRYLVYRLIPPLDHYYLKMGIYQRDLEGFSERPVIENQNFSIGRNGCMNCHSFRNNRTDRMSLQVRTTDFGRPMVVIKDGVAQTVNTSASGLSKSPAAYQDWNPDGRHIAFTVNTVMPLEHTIGEHRDAWDENSDVAVYDTDANRVLTSDGVAHPDRRENWPSWSADGRTLYFVSAPQLPWTELREVKYDLMRISFDPGTGAWGEPDTMLAATECGRSAAQPKESPDGRWLLFVLAHHGNFPTYQPTSEMHVIDLETGEQRPLTAVNQTWAGSWPTWSSNGRWIAFSSKRENGCLARVYFSYFDRDGQAHKPFVLPQEDPSFYESCIMTYNLPELILDPVPLSPSQLGRAITTKPALPAPSLVRE